jgi:hypothetical protein
MAEAAARRDVYDNAGVLAGRVRGWLASSRIQSPDGAYCAWLDVDAGTLAFEYPEITGYALTWLAGQVGPDEREIEAGHRAAEWLVNRLRDGDRSARAGFDSGAVYTFDLGMIAAGLLSFGQLTGIAAYVSEGRGLAEKLASLVNGSAGLQAVAADGPLTGRPPQWSTVGRPHLVKCAQALLLAGERATAQRLSTYATENQAADGHFATQPDDAIVMFHPLFYAVEGLWMIGTACNDSSLLDSARKAVEWAWGHQLASSGFPRSMSPSGCGPEQIDVTSQAIRAAILLDADVEGVDAAIRRLVSLARADEDYGHGLVYQPEAEATHLNSWVTMFAGQALTVAAHGAQALRWNTLV